MKLLRSLARQYGFAFEKHSQTKRVAVILSAGMPRSGSTWLFNAARLLLHRKCGQGNVSSGWIGDWNLLPKKQTMLLKMHDYQGSFVKRARIVLYSYRDLRDALASSKRKFGVEPSLELARSWLAADQQWRRNADFLMRYETMIENPIQVISALATTLGMEAPEAAWIAEQLQQMTVPAGRTAQDGYDKQTLLHPSHITDGRHGTWRAWLSPDLLSQIERDYSAWLRENDYPVALHR